jgi:hypothetical protein
MIVGHPRLYSPRMTHDLFRAGESVPADTGHACTYQARPAPLTGRRRNAAPRAGPEPLPRARRGPQPYLLRRFPATATTEPGRVRARDHPQLARMDATHPVTLTVSPDPGAFQAQFGPARCALRHRPLADRVWTSRGLGPEKGAARLARGNGQAGAARGVPSGCTTVRLAGFVAPVSVRVPLIMDTDAPRLSGGRRGETEKVG